MKSILIVPVLLLLAAGCSTTNNISVQGNNGGVGGSISTSVPF